MRNAINIIAADGHKLSAFISRAKGNSKGGVVLVQEIFGVTKQLCELAEQYAEAGFTTVVPALFDRITTDNVFAYDQPEKGLALVKQCNEKHILCDIQAAMDVLDEDNISIIGFCWGGGISYLASSELKLKCAVAYYGTRLPSYLPRTPKCPFQFHFGELDSHSPIEVIQQIQKACPEAEYHVYPNIGHAFANHHKLSFDLKATELAQQRVLQLLQE